MVKSNREPFNIRILKAHRDQLRGLKEIKTLDIFDKPGSSNFHPEGLFSTDIFGQVGTENRDTAFAYIDIKVSVLHPLVWVLLKRVRGLYHDILTGKAYATFDDKTKDFEKSDELEGETGYEFFMSHWEELVIPMGESPIRKQRIEMMRDYRDESVIDKILVMPAGLRDIEVDTVGRTREGEINEHYRRLISIANTIPETNAGGNSVFDKARLSLQNSFNDIYEMIEGLVSGKRGFFLGKWGSRNIINGTRNVISAMDPNISHLDHVGLPGSNDTIAGLWQVSRAALPMFVAGLKNGILNEIFGTSEGSVPLIDTKTLKSEMVEVSPSDFDKWNTLEGLEKVISELSIIDQRDKPIIISDRYLALIYKPKNKKVFKVFTDIDTMPEWVDKKDVHPITYFELIYLSMYSEVNELAALPTRYPVEGEGSIYPSKIYLMTTVRSERRQELGFDWTPLEGDEHLAKVFPILDGKQSYVDTTVVHPSRLAGMGGD